jgi:hypothetical protein
MGLGDFWLGVTVAKNAATGTKPPDRRLRVLSIVGGIALALLIGGRAVHYGGTQWLTCGSINVRI